MPTRVHTFLHRAGIAVAACALVILSAAGGSSRAQSGCAPEDFAAAAVNRSENPVPLSSSVDIHVARWSTQAEKDTFARALLDRGTDALMQALRNTHPVGHIRTTNTFPYDVQFAWQDPLPDGGRRIVLIADRPMVMWREAMRLEIIDDMFTVIELRLSPEGEGEGKVAIASNIHVNRSLDLIELKDYDSAPVRLTDVRPKRPTT